MPSASDSLRASVTAAELEVEGGEDSGVGAHVATEAESLDDGGVNAETTGRQSGGEQEHGSPPDAVYAAFVGNELQGANFARAIMGLGHREPAGGSPAITTLLPV